MGIKFHNEIVSVQFHHLLDNKNKNTWPLIPLLILQNRNSKRDKPY